MKRGRKPHPIKGIKVNFQFPPRVIEKLQALQRRFELGPSGTITRCIEITEERLRNLESGDEHHASKTA